MARRRRSRFPFRTLIALLILAAAAWLTWRYLPAFLHDRARPTGTMPVELPVRERPDVCAMATESRLGAVLGAGDLVAREVGAGADVPAAASCTWSSGPRGPEIVAMLFTRDSLTRGGGKEFGAAYFRSVLTGLEYTFKDAPVMLTGLGDEAALMGFGADTEEPPQIVIRRGERVLLLVFHRVERARAERAARLIGEKF